MPEPQAAMVVRNTLPPGAPFLLLVRRISKQGTPKSITEAHYILATKSLKFRAWIAKF
jgi:hypothetical protein